MSEGAGDLSESKPGAETPADASTPAEEYQEARAQFAARRAYKRAIRRARNPLYLSLRSLLLLASLVLIAATATIALVFALRGDAAASGLAPVIEVLEASQDSPVPDQAQAPEATAAPTVQVILAAETPENLIIEGPALPTVIITNTPIQPSVGALAAVFAVGNDNLNIRNRPSLSDSQVLFRENEGKRFDIIGGPQAADGYTWWQVRDPQFQVTGWAVANYLRTISEDAG